MTGSLGPTGKGELMASKGGAEQEPEAAAKHEGFAAEMVVVLSPLNDPGSAFTLFLTVV